MSDCEVAGPAEAVEAVGKFRDRDKCLKTLNGDLTTLDFCRLLKTEFMFQISMFNLWQYYRVKVRDTKSTKLKVKDFKGPICFQ